MGPTPSIPPCRKQTVAWQRAGARPRQPHITYDTQLYTWCTELLTGPRRNIAKSESRLWVSYVIVNKVWIEILWNSFPAKLDIKNCFFFIEPNDPIILFMATFPIYFFTNITKYSANQFTGCSTSVLTAIINLSHTPTK